MTQRVMLLDDENGAQLLGGGLGSRGKLITSSASFPLLALSLGIFSLINLTGGAGWCDAKWFTIHMMSGDNWVISGGDAFLGLSMVLLFIELIRATHSGGDSIVNHALSAVVFIIALLLFCTRVGFGNSTFFLFTSMTLLDFMAGFIITAVTARRDTMLSMM
jgi:hypothetical protein